jgi:hypothetical protein
MHPDEVSQAIFFHHQPGQGQHGNLIARVVDVADSLAYKAGLGMQGPAQELMESESVIALRLTQDQLDSVMEKMRASSTEAFSMLG